MLKLGAMKAPIARTVWDYWKGTRTPEFIEWFDNEIYGEDGVFEEGFEEDALPNVRRTTRMPRGSGRRLQRRTPRSSAASASLGG